jgi:hypothetical protein
MVRCFERAMYKQIGYQERLVPTQYSATVGTTRAPVESAMA